MIKDANGNEAYCYNCRFWKRNISDIDLGRCLRYPPQIYIQGQYQGEKDEYWFYPQVFESEVCGEFKEDD